MRVPAARGDATRIELRMPDPSCNPYLALALMLRSGLDGIEKQIDPGPPVNKNIYKMSHRERRHLRIDELPGNLSDALDELEKDDLVRETLGDHIFNHFLEAKREEWHDYIRHVSPWEVSRYLGLLLSGRLRADLCEPRDFPAVHRGSGRVRDLIRHVQGASNQRDAYFRQALASLTASASSRFDVPR